MIEQPNGSPSVGAPPTPAQSPAPHSPGSASGAHPPSSTVAELSPCRHCGGPAVVGIGSPPEWLCLAAYEDWLAGLRAQLDEIRHLIDGLTSQPPSGEAVGA